MSPILVRPVREQLEHDRVIRLLQARLKRRYNVAINAGGEQTAAVGTGIHAIYPDLVLTSLERGRRLEGVVEVETGESVNNLEAMAQWAHLARLRAEFSLYVPAGSVDAARRLCTGHRIAVAEIWSYHTIGDQLRFTQVHKAPSSVRDAYAATKARTARRTAARSAARGQRTGTPVRKAAKRAASNKTRRPARSQKRK